jgi:hypothetical protein
MRLWIISALGALALGVIAIPDIEAAPINGRAMIGSSEVSGSPTQEVRYAARCHVVRVWRNTRHGRRLVAVRKCRRVWVR